MSWLEQYARGPRHTREVTCRVCSQTWEVDAHDRRANVRICDSAIPLSTPYQDGAMHPDTHPSSYVGTGLRTCHLYAVCVVLHTIPDSAYHVIFASESPPLARSH